MGEVALMIHSFPAEDHDVKFSNTVCPAGMLVSTLPV